MTMLTHAQQKALRLDKNISVTAGAGSGKTRILVERFLTIVKERPWLTRHTVAITFTEKAAGEMQERIALEVNARIQNAPSISERNNYLQIRDQIGSAYITTIHGFCSRILREFPIEAMVPADFSMLDDIRQKILMNTALIRVFALIEQEASGLPLDDLRLLFRQIPGRTMEDILRRALESPFEMDQVQEKFSAMECTEYLNFLNDLWQQAFLNIVPENAPAELNARLEGILASDSILEKGPRGVKARTVFTEYIDSYRQTPDGLNTYFAFIQVVHILTSGKGQAYKNLAQLGGAKSWGTDSKERLLEASDYCAQYRSILEANVPGSIPDADDRKWYGFLQTILKLYQKTQEIYSNLKNDEAVLDFEDLQLKTRLLLLNRPEIRAILSSRFRYIMVDEFQDTNPVQWEIVRLLAGDVNGQLSTDKVFVVGDPKQAIYGFRNADIRVFKNVKNLFGRQSTDANIVFEESFRFVPKLNKFINRIFADILQEDAVNPFEVGFDPLKTMRDVDAPCQIEITEFEKDDQEHNEYQYIALKIRDLLSTKGVYHLYDAEEKEESPQALKPGNIAILLRSRTPLEAIETALRQEDIPFKTVGGIGFWKQPETFAIYHLLRFLSNPQDDLALIGILRSRFFALGDDTLFLLHEETGEGYLEKICGPLQQPYAQEEREHLRTISHRLKNWLSLRERISLGELLKKIIDDTQLVAILGAEFGAVQRLGNLNKLITLATSFELGNPGGMRAFFAMIDDLIKREVREGQAITELDDDSTVKIMTIHASKGLQFPVVFLPALNSKSSNHGTVLLDGDFGLAISRKTAEKKDKESNTLYGLLTIRNRQKEQAELKRLFYVGASRASDHLYMCATTTNGKPTPNSIYELLAGAVDNAPGPGLFSIGDPAASATDTDSGNKPGISAIIEKLQRAVPRMAQKGATAILQPIPRPVSGRTFSATALMEFIKNPERYYQRYHLGFFEDDYLFFENHSPEPENLSLLKGTLLHRFLELLPWFDDAEPLIERILFENDIFDPDKQTLFRDEILALQKMLVSSVTGQKILQAKHYRNEVSVTCKLGEDYLTGKFDRLQKNDADQWEVIDYKTNKLKPSNVDSLFDNYAIQIKMYALLLATLYPKQGFYNVSLYFLSIDLLKTKCFSAEAINHIRKEFASILSQIKATFSIQ